MSLRCPLRLDFIAVEFLHHHLNKSGEKICWKFTQRVASFMMMIIINKEGNLNLGVNYGALKVVIVVLIAL